MADMHPDPFPETQRKNSGAAIEEIVYNVLQKFLDDGWVVYYDYSIKGTKRRSDFICINPNVGVMAVEAKGSEVHFFRGKFFQLNHKTKKRYPINPLDQVAIGYRSVVEKCGLSMESLPEPLLICFFPDMYQKGLGFSDSPHFYSKENIAADGFNLKFEKAPFPSITPEKSQGLLRFIEALKQQSFRIG